MECPFIIIDHSSHICFQDCKMKIHSFLDLPFQPTFLEHLGMLGPGIDAEEPRPWEMPSGGELNCQQLAIANLKQIAHLLCSFLYFSSFVFSIFIFHCLYFILPSFSLFFPSFLLSHYAMLFSKCQPYLLSCPFISLYQFLSMIEEQTTSMTLQDRLAILGIWKNEEKCVNYGLSE